jgi:DNA-binding MarR family transcriptional regulator
MPDKARIPKPESGSKARLRLWLNLLKATKRVENEVRDHLRREFETTLPRFDVMAMLHKSGSGLKMSELSSELMVSNGNVTGIIDRLVSDGLVIRVSIQGDRRATLVRLTPKGSSEFKHMADAHEGWIHSILGDVPDRDIDAAIATLTRIKESNQ